ncbi:hypothetical protein SAMN06297129_0754 [Pseudooceanicola antarcticus]|uniref:Uncharacterized protein n=1 Tax=Pseudooceanicola antarcticus TaxID=1247613 RepID=A0A285I0Q6_9RHOB|nr:hypothetical protein [Pseudooceanicola antarcticus]PJE30379.1 hypothetical protein CVM39_06640 [Pseudooceanicola antarcticus]SNY40636.1 hypothetical protein SAMN06297129_0754 [Pseudooceanicola antarcticus]
MAGAPLPRLGQQVGFSLMALAGAWGLAQLLRPELVPGGRGPGVAFTVGIILLFFATLGRGDDGESEATLRGGHDGSDAGDGSDGGGD